jgi:hypothetical protein
MLFLLPLLIASTAFSIECSMQAILEANKELLPASQAVIDLGAGQGAFLNPFYVDPNSIPERPALRRKRLLESVQGRNEESLGISFEEVRNNMIAEISGGKPFEELGAPQKLLIERIKLMTWRVDQRSLSEGSNNPDRMEIRFSTTTLKLPKFALVALIAHELGHTLDLCGLGHSRYHKHDHDLQSPAASSDLRELINDSSENFLGTNIKGEDQNVLSALIQGGQVSFAESGIPVSGNPVAITYSCLTSRNNDSYPAIPSSGAGVCNGGHYTEGSAQIWGSRMTAVHARLNPPQSKLEALGFFALMASRGIDVDNIYLSEPTIQEMFGCTPAPAQNCMNNFMPARDTTLNGAINGLSDISPEPKVECK